MVTQNGRFLKILGQFKMAPKILLKYKTFYFQKIEVIWTICFVGVEFFL